MNFLKFLFGIIVAQVATYLLLILVPGELNFAGFFRVAVALLFIALILAFWFISIAGHDSKDAVTKVKDDFYTEHDKLRSSDQKVISKVNFKVGAAFAGLLGVGVLLLFAQMMTAGLLAISASIGAMVGYYWRGKAYQKR